MCGNNKKRYDANSASETETWYKSWDTESEEIRGWNRGNHRHELWSKAEEERKDGNSRSRREGERKGQRQSSPCVDGTKRVPRTTMTTTKEKEKERKPKGKEGVCAATMPTRLSSRVMVASHWENNLAKFGYIQDIKVGNNNNNPFIFLDTCWNLSSKSEDLENK
jgi:hypothetical protein